jgi:hypothetical protein
MPITVNSGATVRDITNTATEMPLDYTTYRFGSDSLGSIDRQFTQALSNTRTVLLDLSTTNLSDYGGPIANQFTLQPALVQDFNSDGKKFVFFQQKVPKEEIVNRATEVQKEQLPENFELIRETGIQQSPDHEDSMGDLFEIIYVNFGLNQESFLKTKRNTDLIELSRQHPRPQEGGAGFNTIARHEKLRLARQ